MRKKRSLPLKKVGKKVVEKDLKILKKILPLALRFVDSNLRYSAKTMLSQFIETIHEELDYTNESKNLKEIKNDMANNSNWLSLYGVSILTGIGFTMSLFVGNLAFVDNTQYIDGVKIGVLSGSLLSTIFGYLILLVSVRK